MPYPATHDLHEQPFPSRRSAVRGTRGMVATSQPLAAQIGLNVLAAGGDAVDAAVATAAALAVVEPTGTGIGGDAFALVYRADDGSLHALNGSGRSPRGLDMEAVRADGVPQRGARSVTVPGAVRAWEDLVSRFGRFGLTELLEPAIELATGGFPVSELIARSWRASEPLLSTDPDARAHLLFDGRGPRAGQVVRLPAMGRSLGEIAEQGASAVYEGPIGEAIVQAVGARGGWLAMPDLNAHRSEWVEPVRVTYGPWRIWECPPNGQGLAALVALGILTRLESASSWDTPERLVNAVVAMRAGFEHALPVIGDPEVLGADAWTEVLDPEFLADQAAAVRAGQMPGGRPARGSDTVYLSVVDAHGNGCSFISSNYMGFGSGVVAGDTGIPLQNRGAGFVFEPGHVNHIGPGKRPFHTIIPGLATDGSTGELRAVFGVMGGHMQPQGHLQVVSNLLDWHMDPQQALDAPRFQIRPDGRVALEPWFNRHHRRALERVGVTVTEDVLPAGTFGGGQLIQIDAHDVRTGGSDPRKDGQAVAQP